MFEIWKRSRQFLHWVRTSRQGTWGIVASALQHTFTLETSLTAAAISYFALFSFFPLILFTSMIAGAWLEPVLGRSEVVAQLDFIAPALGYLLERHLQRIVDMEQSLTAVLLLSLLWSSSTIFHVLRRTLERVWQITVHRPIWHQRGTAVITVLGLISLLLITSLAYSTIVSLLRVFTPSELLPLALPLSQAANLGISVLLFGLLYRFLPYFPVEWRDVWPGALAGGVLWEISKRVFFFYATTYMAQPNLTELVYGSIAAVIAFMAWSYFSGIIYIFGAHLNYAYYESRREPPAAGQTQGEHPTDGQSGGFR